MKDKREKYTLFQSINIILNKIISSAFRFLRKMASRMKIHVISARALIISFYQLSRYFSRTTVADLFPKIKINRI